MTPEQIFDADAVLSHALVHPQVARLLPPTVIIYNGRRTQEIAFTCDDVRAVIDVQHWSENRQGRWAWALALPGIYVGGVGLGGTPDERGYTLECHWVAAATLLQLRAWFDEWLGDGAVTARPSDGSSTLV